MTTTSETVPCPLCCNTDIDIRHCAICDGSGTVAVEYEVKFGEGTVHVSVCVKSHPWTKGATSMPWEGEPDEAKFVATPDYAEMKDIALGDLSECLSLPHIINKGRGSNE